MCIYVCVCVYVYEYVYVYVYVLVCEYVCVEINCCVYVFQQVFRWNVHWKKVCLWRLFGKVSRSILWLKPCPTIKSWRLLPVSYLPPFGWNPPPTVPPLVKDDDIDIFITSVRGDGNQNKGGRREWNWLPTNTHPNTPKSVRQTILFTGVGRNEFKSLLSVGWTYKVLNAIKTTLTAFQAKAWEMTLV